MAALISDLDGTVFKWGTEEFLPGAHEELTRWLNAGNQIIFVTQRESWFGGRSTATLERFLKKEFPGCGLITNVSSPRILVNDQGAVAVNHRKNSPFRHDLLRLV